MRAGYILLIAALMSGCVRERPESFCPLPAGDGEPESGVEAIEIEARDILSGTDLTPSGRLDHASLLVFDADERFVRRIDVTAEELARRVPIPVSELGIGTAQGGTFHIAAWGNIDGKVDLTNIEQGHAMERQFVSLMTDHSNGHTMVSPGEIFFGRTTVTIGEGDSRTSDEHARASDNSRIHTVSMTQHNARMFVTVRGLPADARAEDYFLSLCEQNDGFTCGGVPVKTSEACMIRQSGVFNAAHDFVSTEAYWVIPSVDPLDAAGCLAGVCLYKVGAGNAATQAGSAAKTRAVDSGVAGYVNPEGDINLTGKALVDTDGDHIALKAGLTTNILLTFGASGSITMDMELTPWDQIHQWTIF